MVVLVLFAIEPPWWVSLVVVITLAIAMFLPIKFVHPVRTERWRLVSLPMIFAWTFFAGWANYYLGVIAADSTSLGIARQAFRKLLDIDEAIKTGKTDGDVALDTFVVVLSG